jgi:hypothetical protein
VALIKGFVFGALQLSFPERVLHGKPLILQTLSRSIVL